MITDIHREDQHTERQSLRLVTGRNADWVKVTIQRRILKPEVMHLMLEADALSAISRIDGAASTKSDGPQWCQAAFPVSVSRRV